MTDPQSLNKYHYAYNNPLLYIDPDGHQGVREHARRVWDNVRAGAGAVGQTVRETINGAASAVSENNGFGRMDAPQNKVGRAIGHAVSLAQSTAEIVGGAEAIAGGGTEAVVTSPAATTGVGALLPAAGATTAVGGLIVAAHGGAVGINTIVNIFSKGKDGHPAKDQTTVQGTQDQLDDITANQAAERKVGKPDKIQSIEKSKQAADTALKKVKKLEDVEEPE